MITIDLKGNLGNQLFEYAFARALQEKTGQKIIINTYFQKKFKPEYTCNLQNYVLNNNVEFCERKLPWYVNTYKGPVRYLKKMSCVFFKIWSNFNVFIWLKEYYKKISIKSYKKDIYLVGYWQSTKYFKDIDDVIRQEFVPKEDRLECNKDLYSIIENTESVCVTIRRGDYVSNPKYKKIFYLCNLNYFKKAIEIMKKKINNPVFIFFSDDIEWVKENLKVENAFYENGNDPVWEKLRLMSTCKHFIISNSSFSWWAQHLSNNANKVVISPNKWFPDNRKCDIFEPGWDLIDME